MIEVRFLESCYVFSTGKSYNFDDIAKVEEELADNLFERGIVDILKDEEFVKDEEPDVNLESLTVEELKGLAAEHDIAHSGLRKAELIEAIEEVL